MDVRSIGLEVQPAVLFSGDEIVAKVRITADAGQPVARLKVGVRLENPDGDGIELAVDTVEQRTADGSREMIFVGRGAVGGSAGPARIVAKISGLDPIEDFVVILPGRSEP